MCAMAYSYLTYIGPLLFFHYIMARKNPKQMPRVMGYDNMPNGFMLAVQILPA